MLLDFYNNVYRACIGFGPPRNHSLCNLLEDNTCSHTKSLPHCECGAKWDESDQQCYGQKYVFIFNFFRNLRPLVEDGSPDKIFAVMEGHPQFRYDLLPTYKANRIVKKAAKSQEDVDKFQVAKDEIIRLMQFLPITIAHAQHYEADDVIGSLVENMKDEDLTVITGDKDYLQLLQKGFRNIIIYSPIKKENMVAREFSEACFKMLTGDKSDNIPRLVSDKKALKFLSDPPAFKEWMSVQENQSNFAINKQLVEFRQVPEEEIILQEGQRNFEALKQEFERMDFQSIVNDKSWKKYVETFDCVKY